MEKELEKLIYTYLFFIYIYVYIYNTSLEINTTLKVNYT